ncbi:MAG: DNA polymerase III subunit beta [Bdellovibrionales bacterium RIFOXYD1_FULL_44_7]|nr:MAG: DNA polymerase III subunit beta [Bdellovibrionales bacterium RIFOXYD1_FULL_44_7]
MKFSIERDLLFEALQKTQSVVEKRNTVQILANILCTVKDQYLSLSATDLEVGIKVNVPVEAQQEGRITLSAKHFFDIVKELPSKKLDVTRKDNNWVEIVCGKARFNVVSLSAEEYPALPIFEEKKYIDAKIDDLKDMIDRTAFAVSTDSTRYLLNGVFFECLEKNISRMTATDGHRLSFVDHEVFITIPDLKRGIIIPKKGLNELRKLIEQGSSSVGLSFERGYIFVKLDDTHLFIRLIEGEYPDYRQVIPKSTDRVVVMNSDLFTSALKRISLLANEKSRGVKLTLQGATLTISSSNPDLGEAREEIDTEYNGDPIDIGFNSKYLLDCMSIIKSEKIELHLKDRLSPGILKETGQLHHTYVIMPMRI